MRRRRRATISELREAVQCLPRATREAMLDSLDSGPIIAGAYATVDGVCPMLAAHRTSHQRHDRGAARAGNPDRGGELRERIGWSWSRLFRRYDEYELALRRLHEATACESPPRERAGTRARAI
jgi:hypothetical protein